MSPPRLSKAPRIRDYIFSDWMSDIVVNIVAAVGVLITIEEGMARWKCVVAILSALVLLLWSGIIFWRHKTNMQDVEWLTPFLRSLHHGLQEFGTPDPKLRLCVLIRDTKETTMQVTEYIGGVASTEMAGRKFNCRQGMVGMAIIKRGGAFGCVPEWESREDFLNRLAYDAGEIASIDPSRKAWGAVCIGKAEDFQAVIFCDSTLDDYFGKHNKKTRQFPVTTRQRLMHAAGLALSEHLYSRHPY